MSECFVEESRDEGSADVCDVDASDSGDSGTERPRREILISGRGRRACSEQGPHPTFHLQHGTSHLWGSNSGRRGWSRKRTSAPQMGGNLHGSMPRVALVLRSRRSWPVAPQSYRSRPRACNKLAASDRSTISFTGDRGRRRFRLAVGRRNGRDYHAFVQEY